MPEGGDSEAHLELFAAALLEFAQRQVGLRADPLPERGVMPGQPGPAVAWPVS